MASPESVRWLACTAAAVPDGNAWLGDAEQVKQTTLRFAKRRDDWRLKRWTAKQALARVTGVEDPRRVEVLNTDDGAPVAYLDGEPLSLTVSLTDSAGVAVCAVGRAATPLGCDLERVEARSAAFVADWLTPAEQAAVAGAADAAVAANLVWSAKEATLKALGVGLRRPTRSVEITAAPEAAGDGWAPFEAAVEDATWRGWWRRYGEFVLTVVAADAGEPPVAL